MKDFIFIYFCFANRELNSITLDCCLACIILRILRSCFLTGQGRLQMNYFINFSNLLCRYFIIVDEYFGNYPSVKMNCYIESYYNTTFSLIHFVSVFSNGDLEPSHFLIFFSQEPQIVAVGGFFIFENCVQHLVPLD